jgi:hypothetical protein
VGQGWTADLVKSGAGDSLGVKFTAFNVNQDNPNAALSRKWLNVIDDLGWTQVIGLNVHIARGSEISGPAGLRLVKMERRLGKM